MLKKNMNHLASGNSYRKILQGIFDARVAKNKRYSMRAFARDLSLSPAFLSQILNDKKGLSPRSANRVANKLDLPQSLKIVFCDLVDLEHSRSPSRRRLAKKRLGRFDVGDICTLDDDHFVMIQEWYHFAILELTNLDFFNPDPAWIASRLGIEWTDAVTAIERLKRLGCLKVIDGTLHDCEPILSTTTDIPNEAIRSFHKGIQENLKNSIDSTSPERRRNEAMICSLSSKDFGKLKLLIEKFQEDVVEIASSKSKKESVYCVNINMWDLVKHEESN